MADQIKTTIKKFERTICTKHAPIRLEKREHFDNGLDKNGDPAVTKLWLYYANGKHVGTYNRSERYGVIIGD